MKAIKTYVHLPENIAEQVRTEAEAKGWSISRLIATAVAAYLLNEQVRRLKQSSLREEWRDKMQDALKQAPL